MDTSKLFSMIIVAGAMAFINAPTAFSNESTMTPADTDLVRKIREDVAADAGLSPYAQNMKIFASNGKVTLQGKVASDVERQNVVSKVNAEAGVSSVDSRLDLINSPQANPPQTSSQQ